MADTQSKSKTGLIIGIAGGALVLLLIAAVAFGNQEVGSEFGDPALDGEALPPMGNQTLDLGATGLPIPNVSGQDFDGSDVSIRNDDGRAKAIVFLAHWCQHCQAEVPRVQDWLDAGGGVDGVDMYSVATAMNSGRPNYPPSAWLDREGWTAPVLRDDQVNTVLTAYGSGGFPYWVFTNADGTVAARTAGELTIEQLETLLTNLEQ